MFLEDINDDAFAFIHVLDWLDILEFRVIPVAVENVKKFFCKSIPYADRFKACNIVELLCNHRSDYPFSERLGIFKQSNRKALWNIRKNLLPQENANSDVNLSEDIEIFDKIVKLIRKKAGVDETPLEKREHILTYISERNRIRQGYKHNGSIYALMLTDMELADTECMDACLAIFDDLAQNTDINNLENIISVICIHHLLFHELLEEEQDDLKHPQLPLQKSSLEYTYRKFEKQVLESIFYTYTGNKSLLMNISFIEEYSDELLSEMLMIGSKYLENSLSDNILKKVFEPVSDATDIERNNFLNKTWNSMDIESRTICFLHFSDVGILERINCTEERHLSVEEKDFAVKMSEVWITELNKINSRLHI